MSGQDGQNVSKKRVLFPRGSGLKVRAQATIVRAEAPVSKRRQLGVASDANAYIGSPGT